MNEDSCGIIYAPELSMFDLCSWLSLSLRIVSVGVQLVLSFLNVISTGQQIGLSDDPKLVNIMKFWYCYAAHEYMNRYQTNSV